MAPELPIEEVFQRYVSGSKQPEIKWWIALAGVALAAIALPVLLRRPRRQRGALAALLIAPIIVLALVRAWSLAWVADDAFISFRFADNLVRGHGLVFNPGERVEGYTNFLWTLLAALALALRQSPIEVALVVSMLSYAAVIVLVTRLVHLLSPPGAPVTVSFAALAVAGNYVMACYATSGLETMTATCMVLLSLERATVGRPLAAGLAGIAAALLHPDHLVFYGALGAVLVLERNRRQLLWRYWLPFVLLFVPYFAWRYGYYGELYPNTYYAKAGNLRYFSQGRVYLLVNVFAAGVAAAVPIAALGLLRNLHTIVGRFAWLAVPVYLIWIAKIGGDFMVGRLLVPIIPIVLVLAEAWSRRVLVGSRFWAPLGLAGAATVLVAGIPTTVILPGEKKFHLADERTFYPLASLRPLAIDNLQFEQGRLFERTFDAIGLRPRYATGCVGMVGYLSRLRIIDTLGLNDKIIAKKPIGKRGRPGHERTPTAGDVIPRAPDFSDEQHYPAPYDRLNSVWLEKHRFYVMAFRGGFIDALTKHQPVVVTDARTLIDSYDALRAGSTPEERACDAWFYGTYYFDHNHDPARATRFAEKLGAADPGVGAAASLLTYEPARDDPYWQEVARESFDGGAGSWQRSGDAFAAFPETRQQPMQETIGFRRGAYANSYAPGATDDATGRVARSFEIMGDAVTLRVGGGAHADGLRVSLIVDDRPVRSATGCNSDVLGRRAWDVSELRGRPALLEIVDARVGPWGHIVVDEIVQWRRR